MWTRGIAVSRLCVYAAMLSLGGVPAGAGSFSHPYLAVALSSGATFGTSSILLPKSGAPTFEFAIVLPADYRANGKVEVALYLLTDTNNVSCTAVVRPYFLRRHRNGLPFKLDVDATGITPANGDLSTGFPGSVVARKVFDLRRSPNFPGQRAGDLITLGFFRHTSHVLDSCPNLVEMLGIDIRYPNSSAP